jgi:spore coat protein U-like protein
MDYGSDNVHRLKLSGKSAFNLAGPAAALVLVAPTAASAGTQATNMPVSATVTANCTISAGSVLFGNVNTMAGNHDATGTVTVSCTNGAAWSVSAGAGNGASATMAVRRLTSGANTLNYSLYTSGTYGTVWGDGTSGTAAISGTGNGAAQSFTVYGRIPSGQTSVPTGSYSDLVSITVTY